MASIELTFKFDTRSEDDRLELDTIFQARELSRATREVREIIRRTEKYSNLDKIENYVKMLNEIKEIIYDLPDLFE